MKNQIFTLGLFLLIMGGFSQNYRCISNNATHYFEDAETIKAIQVDSVVIEGENQHYYIYPTFAEGDDPWCYTQYGPSWIGKRMTDIINGDNVFYNLEDEPITIKTLADLGEEWTCYVFASGNYITATFSEIQSMEFLLMTSCIN
jgi:hypothetical protein